MVQEVERVKAELDVLLFVEREVLVQRKIAVEVRRSLDVRPDDVADLARLRWREAARVEILPRLEARARIARQYRDERRGRCAQILLGTDSDVAAVVKNAAVGGVQRGIDIGAGERLDRRPALQLCETGELPAVHDALEDRIAMDRTREVEHVRRIEDLAMVVCEDAVICVDAISVFGGAGLVTVEGLTIARAEGFAEGVVQQPGTAAGLLFPLRDKRVVV